MKERPIERGVLTILDATSVAVPVRNGLRRGTRITAVELRLSPGVYVLARGGWSSEVMSATVVFSLRAAAPASSPAAAAVSAQARVSSSRHGRTGSHRVDRCRTAQMRIAGPSRGAGGGRADG